MTFGEPPRATEKRTDLWFVFAGLVYFGALAFYAYVRPFDGDEGYYATAARLVWEGRTLYRDFFYAQTPLLPCIYSWVWGVYPHSLFAMRLVSVACGAVAVTLWGVYLVRAKPLSPAVTIVTFGMVVLNPYWVSWHAVVKTYAVADLLISAAVLSLYAGLHSGRARWYFLSGLALGACASVRALYGPLVPVVFAWLLCRDRRTSVRVQPKDMAFLAGAFIGLLAIIVGFLRDPQAFVFDNFRYHSLQAGYHLVNGKAVVGYGTVKHALSVYLHFGAFLLKSHPWFVAALLLAAAGVLSLWKSGKEAGGWYTREDRLFLELNLLMLLIYAATASVPFPPYDQYFDAPMFPFLLPFMAEGIRKIAGRVGKWAIPLLLGAPMAFAWQLNRETSDPPPWKTDLPSYYQIARKVEINSAPNDVVLSFWPGYVFESGRRYFPGLEDNFTNRVTDLVTPSERIRYHLVRTSEVLDAVSSGGVGVVVFAPYPWMDEFYANLSPTELAVFHAALRTNYSRLCQVGTVSVYARKPGMPGRDPRPLPPNQ